MRIHRQCSPCNQFGDDLCETGSASSAQVENGEVGHELGRTIRPDAFETADLAGLRDDSDLGSDDR